MSHGNIKGKTLNNQNSKQNQSIALNKQNSTKSNLSKSQISKNNNIVIKEIIMFRLYYKTLQRLKENQEVPDKLKNILGNETIRRVTVLKKLICSSDLSTNQHFSLDDV